MKDLTIIVNTSDNFEDCWTPFFTLFKKYWPDCPYPIVLNTETKDWSFPGVNIRCARVAAGESRRLTWSECFARCLDGIDTPYVLYLQEDFFLEAPVNTAMIETFVDAMRRGEADAVRLMECGGAGPWKPTNNPLLWEVDAHSKYRISLQAVLWRKSTLRAHVRPHESPWQLEIFGSRRAARAKNEKILCVNRDRFHGPGKEVFPYTPTGVISGKWAKDIVVPLFEKHAIAMDFARRGFYDRNWTPPKRPLTQRVHDRLRSLF